MAIPQFSGAIALPSRPARRNYFMWSYFPDPSYFMHLDNYYLTFFKY
jgi:hypothetical protein